MIRLIRSANLEDGRLHSQPWTHEQLAPSAGRRPIQDCSKQRTPVKSHLCRVSRRSTRTTSERSRISCITKGCSCGCAESVILADRCLLKEQLHNVCSGILRGRSGRDIDRRRRWEAADIHLSSQGCMGDSKWKTLTIQRFPLDSARLAVGS